MLQHYDMLLFPTHWIGEGYPGIIIEAYHAGIPVITTGAGVPYRSWSTKRAAF